jgi:hypothetical protein
VGFASQKKRKSMKTKFILLASGCSLVLTAPALPAQDTNADHLVQTWKYLQPFENDRSLSERALLPPGLKEKLNLTDEQRVELKPVEDDFANTSWEYKVTNQARLDAARKAIRQAHASKETALIQAAYNQLEQVWAGLEPYRAAAVSQIKPLLTPDQLVILEDEQNQWHEPPADEPIDPPAN